MNAYQVCSVPPSYFIGLQEAFSQSHKFFCHNKGRKEIDKLLVEVCRFLASCYKRAFYESLDPSPPKPQTEGYRYKSMLILY